MTNKKTTRKVKAICLVDEENNPITFCGELLIFTTNKQARQYSKTLASEIGYSKVLPVEITYKI